MNIKKIGIWGGGFIGSFIVLLILVYFLFPYLNPEKVAKVAQKKAMVENTTFDPSQYSFQSVDSLHQKISSQQSVIDSLMQAESLRKQHIDSLKVELAMALKKEPRASTANGLTNDTSPIEEATKPLLSLDEDALGPIVDLLDEQQLISLYRKGSGRQREKLLRTLKPEKAAKILKKVM